MNFNIYIDEKLGLQVTKLAKLEKKTRNSIIREAIQEWVSQHSEKPKWPEKILAFNGIKSFPMLEDNRKKLTSPKKDPFA